MDIEVLEGVQGAGEAVEVEVREVDQNQPRQLWPSLVSRAKLAAVENRILAVGKVIAAQQASDQNVILICSDKGR